VDFLDFLEVVNGADTGGLLGFSKNGIRMWIIPLTFSELEKRSTSKSSIDDLIFLHSSCNLCSESPDKGDVWPLNHVFPLPLSSIVIHVFVINIVQSVNPVFVIKVNKVDKF